MRVIILDAADEVVNTSFEGTPEQIAAAIPEGGRFNVWTDPEPEAAEELPTVPVQMLKLAIFNANGYPSQVLDIDQRMAVEWIRKLPPTNAAVTLTGTPYANTMIPGDLPSLANLQAELEVTSGGTE